MKKGKNMKLKHSHSIMNLGDTSFRRAQLINDYKIMLPLLAETLNNSGTWGQTNDSQYNFYRLVVNAGLVSNKIVDDYISVQRGERLEEIKKEYYKKKYFTDKYNSYEEIVTEDLLDYLVDYQKQRGRTYSNPLCKIGLVDEKRRITQVGKSLLNEDIQLDNLERLLQLDAANIIFLRQLLKLRVYDPDKMHYYYPIRVAFYLLSKYESIISSDFTDIINLIRPTMKPFDILEIINDYENVLSGQITSGEYFDKHFPLNSSKQNFKSFYKNGVSSLDEFSLFFGNGKSLSTSKDYYNLFLILNKFNKNPSDKLAEKLSEIGKKDTIKKAFGFNKNLFKYEKGDSWKEFKEKNCETLLLDDNPVTFRMAFHSTFASSKRYDLTREYRDMTVRTLKLCGLISFDKKIARLGQRWITSSIFSSPKIESSFSGTEHLEAYEGNKDNCFYQELTTMEILNLSPHDFTVLIETVRECNNLDDQIELSSYFEEKFYQDFIQKINQRFSNKEIIEILTFFKDKSKHKKIKEKVTEMATIPTIFEYILGIAWHRISGQSYNLFNSLNLTLDADFYPISHAPGGDGDIVITNANQCLMLEATLMDKNAQKRGELEPVIRHTANLAIREKGKQVLTIFVADELDNNVINIFRAASYTQLESTQQRGKFVDGITIFALSISELIEIMNKNISQQKIISLITEQYSNPPAIISTGWREEIIENILT